MKTIAIVGKPNVGKSSLFNRIIKKNKAIVHDYAGVTRDRLYAEGEWLLKKFNIIDTGGLTNKNLTFQENINEQVLFAIEEADIIIFLVSAINSIDAEDFYVNKILKKYKNNKKIILVANKADAKNKINENLFYQLGYGKPIFTSCTHGIGIGNLLDEIIKNIGDENQQDENKNFSFCIIGKPNVGKSSTVNAILNKNQVIVSEIAGSTRDSTDSEFKYYNNNLTIIDTAGIKRKGKLKESLDKISYFKAEKAIKRSNLILFMLDGSIPFSEQDEVIGGLAFSANIPTIIVVNKIDLIKDFNDQKRQQIINEIRLKFKFLNWAPIFFISSEQKKKLNQLIELILKIKDKVKIKINNSLLNEVVAKSEMMNKPPIHNGNRISISYITQVESQIPTFVLFCNNPKYLHFSYARYIENQIRSAFELNDVPVCLYWKEKNSKNRTIEWKK